MLPDSFDMLRSSCLAENPWHKFPFSGFLAMLSALVTLMVDSMATSLYSRKNGAGVKPESQVEAGDQEMAVSGGGHFHAHHHGHLPPAEGIEGSQLLRYRVVAMVRYILNGCYILFNHGFLRKSSHNFDFMKMSLLLCISFFCKSELRIQHLI